MPASNYYLLSLAICAFVVQSEVVQLIQGPQSYYKPWFLLFIAHSTYVLLIPAQYIHHTIILKRTYPQYKDLVKENIDSLAKFGVPPNPVSFNKRIFWLTVIFTSASLNWYISVSKIALSDITAIYNTSCFFTYILSTIILNEQFQSVKAGAVLISIAGIYILSLQNLQTKNHTVFADAVVGYFTATLSSLCVAGYEILYTKVAIPQRPSIFFSIYITGLVGFVTMLFGPFMFVILHYTGLETFQLPGLNQWPLIIFVAVLGICFNTLFLLVITFAGPVFAASGILISIPLTSIVDNFINDTPFTLNFLAGSLCIMFGFIILQSQGQTGLQLRDERELLICND